MLNIHPSICIPPESHFFLWLEEKYSDFNFEDLPSYIIDLFHATKFETWEIDKKTLKKYLDKVRPNNYKVLTSNIYRFYIEKENKTPIFWGDKNSLWVEKLDTIDKYYPQAFIIHIVRDGRDIACSYRELNSRKLQTKYAPKLPNDIKSIASIWNRNNLAIEEFLDKKIEANYVQISYEDLIRNQRLTIEKVLKPLGLSFVSTQLDYYKKDKSSIEPDEFFLWKEKLLKPPLETNIGKYLNLLTNEEIITFNNIANLSLKQYGYL